MVVNISRAGPCLPRDRIPPLVPLVLGVNGLALSLAYEVYIPSTPMLPIAILKHRTAAICFFGTFLLGIVQFAMLYFLPLYYQVRQILESHLNASLTARYRFRKAIVR